MASAAGGGTRSPDTWALRPQGLDSAVADSSFSEEPEGLQRPLTLVCRCAHPQRGVWGCGWRRPRPLRLLGFSPHTRETRGICRLLAACSQCGGQRPTAHSLKCLHRAGGVNQPGTRSGKRGHREVRRNTVHGRSSCHRHRCPHFQRLSLECYDCYCPRTPWRPSYRVHSAVHPGALTTLKGRV